MTTKLTVRVCAVGLKGAEFLRGLICAGVKIHAIASYPQQDDQSNGYQKIADLAVQIGLDLITTKRPDLGSDGVTFVVGWQYLFTRQAPHVIIFHDSLLPRYRGFAPTVTAMLNGDPVVGVTALQIADDVDAGPIVARQEIPINYPVKIRKVMGLQAEAMVELAIRILHQAETIGIVGTKQDEKAATYSVWRDKADYQIDWSKAGDEICRMVDALGYPYEGARTQVGGYEIVVEDAEVVGDLYFERRDVGKIWQMDEGRPIVICGEGLVRLNRIKGHDDRPFQFRLRTRLG